MICMARTWARPETVPAGKPAASASSGVDRAQLALHIGDDVHHLAVALDEELVGDLDRADLGDPADIVAAEVQQHQVLGALLGVGEQLLFQRLVLLRGGAAAARAGDRPDGDRAVVRTRISGLEPATAKPP